MLMRTMVPEGVLKRSGAPVPEHHTGEAFLLRKPPPQMTSARRLSTGKLQREAVSTWEPRLRRLVDAKAVPMEGFSRPACLVRGSRGSVLWVCSKQIQGGNS